MEYFEWFKFAFWRFVFVQQEVAKAAQSFIEFPPMQKGASFNLEALKGRAREEDGADEAPGRSVTPL